MSTGVVGDNIGALPSVLPDSLNVCVVRFTIYSNLAVSHLCGHIRHRYGLGTQEVFYDMYHHWWLILPPF